MRYSPILRLAGYLLILGTVAQPDYARAEPGNKVTNDVQPTMPSSEEAVAIRGVWLMTNDEFIDGKGTKWLEASRSAPPVKWQIGDGTIVINDRQTITYTIDPSRKPMAITIKGSDYKWKFAIIKLEHGKVVVSLSDEGFPKDFSPTPPARRRHEFARDAAAKPR